MLYFLRTQEYQAKESREKMGAKKEDVLKRLNYIEGHLKGIGRMVNEDQYCVDILRQTYAVRKAIEKLEAIILDNQDNFCQQHSAVTFRVVATGNSSKICLMEF